MCNPRRPISVHRLCEVNTPEVREMSWLQGRWEVLGRTELLESHCKLKVPLDFSDLQLRQPSLPWSPKKKYTKLLWPLSPVRQSPAAQEKHREELSYRIDFCFQRIIGIRNEKYILKIFQLTAKATDFLC